MVWRAPEPSCKLRAESRERLVWGAVAESNDQDVYSGWEIYRARLERIG
jgi:hypothetical protein